jgi:hypothetical protein
VWNFRTAVLQENVAVENFEVKEMKEQFFIHFHVWRLIVAVHRSVTFVDVTHMSKLSSTMAGCRAFPHSLQKLPSAGVSRIFVSTFKLLPLRHNLSCP